MINKSVPQEWRPKARWKRRFYAVYMKWLERIGYLVVAGVIGSFIYAFNYKVDELIKADGVLIEPSGETIKAEDSLLVVKSYVENGQEVKKGEHLLDIVVGDAEIEKWRLKELIAKRKLDLKSFSGYDPKVTPFVASADGTVVFDNGMSDGKKQFEADDVVLRIANFDELIAKASLSGQSVAMAEVGNEAIVSSVTVEPKNGILFRGFDGSRTVISGELNFSAFQEEISKFFKDKFMSFPNDRRFTVKQINEIQIDAKIKTKEFIPERLITSFSSTVVEPTNSQVYKGTVESGEHISQFQLGSLPLELRKVLDQMASTELKSRSSFINDENKNFTITDVSGMNIVLKGDAVFAGLEHVMADFAGVPTKRTFDAEIRIPDPGLALKESVRKATLDGRKVTARIEVKTGTKPIAFTLLKKS